MLLGWGESFLLEVLQLCPQQKIGTLQMQNIRFQRGFDC
jgi:hypothetical protein